MANFSVPGGGWANEPPCCVDCGDAHSTTDFIGSSCPRAADATVARAPPPGLERLCAPRSSASDDRSYRVVRLANGVTCALVSDPAGEKAAAALSVGVGAYADRKDRAGLAHFLEHMLFQGTATYPADNAYKEYVATHGGSTNASTSGELTTFQFDVVDGAFAGALDRFGRFFSEPLLAASCVDREMHAVDAEHSKNLQDDGRRAYQVLRLSASPAHSFSNFSTGCLETLRFDGVRDALLEFWRDRYDPAIATACLVGPRSLEDLEELCVATFGAMAKRGAFEAAPEAAPLFPPIARVHERVPVRDLRSLRVIWPLDFGLREAYWNGGERVVTHALGHEGPNSLLASLKREGLAHGLSTAVAPSLKDAACFSLSVDLTPRGEARRYSDVLPRIFEAVGALARDCEDAVTPRRLWRELAVVSGARFDFMYSKASAYGLAPSLARSLQDHAPADALVGGRTGLAARARRRLEPAARRANEVFAFADDAGRRAASARPPACFADGGLACWWKTDATFGQPKAYVTVRVASPFLGGAGGAASWARTQLWTRVVLEALDRAAKESDIPNFKGSDLGRAERPLYDATCSGLGYDVGAAWAKGCVDVDVSGLAGDGLRRLLDAALEGLADAASPALGAFDRCREKLARHLRNLDKGRADAHAARGSTLVARPSPNAAADENAALQRSYDVGSRDDLAVHAATSLFVHVFKEPFFTQLRTREQLCEQLGYLVSARYASTRGRLHVVLTVQSKTADPPALRDRFDAFVRSFDVASVDLERAKDALATKWTEPDDSMYREASRFWGEVDHPAPEGPLFDRADRVAARVRAVTRDELAAFHAGLLSDDRRCLDVMCFGKGQDAAVADPDLADAPFHDAPPRPAAVA
ncbi:metalloendopeptidase [Aureococcus anophagefferens]|uniref:Metalloendopeptidase n=1 Tax=Aureococcus anophagefferens TaxID=44056 RepID=A0ABR1FH83_AURAN